MPGGGERGADEWSGGQQTVRNEAWRVNKRSCRHNQCWPISRHFKTSQQNRSHSTLVGSKPTIRKKQQGWCMYIDFYTFKYEIISPTWKLGGMFKKICGGPVTVNIRHNNH